ncbi:MAG: hypothetical protein P8O09_06680 [Flavobacteriaceae bacterium]|nr:hypothetical protein [Flavobacteriaceae bacterium]
MDALCKHSDCLRIDSMGLLHSFIYCLSNFDLTGLILSVGMVLTTNGINVGHELGHRQG